jgi:hypothetical protein
VWDGINRIEKRGLIGLLQMLVEFEVEASRAPVLSAIDHLLGGTRVSMEHATNVSQFCTVLAHASPQAIGEMISMSQPGPTEFVLQGPQEDNGSHDASTLTRTATTAASSRTPITNAVERNTQCVIL